MPTTSAAFNSPARQSEYAALITQWLQSRLSTEQLDWLQSQLNKITQSNSDRDLHITLGLIPRKLSRDDLAPTDAERNAADECYTGWKPDYWSIDTAARIAVVLHLADQRGEGFNDTVTDLIRNADLAESIALYSGLPLYPYSESLQLIVGDGLRSNIKSVFEAIAHHNPYPADHFDDNRWNHMVLKALFVDSKLAPIVGLDNRANAELAGILCDYAHERWSANRPVSYELWRCVGPFANDRMVDDLDKASQSSIAIEKHAALLALSACRYPKAAELVNRHTQIANDISSGALSWHTIEHLASNAT